jgi:hypothetical protein
MISIVFIKGAILKRSSLFIGLGLLLSVITSNAQIGNSFDLGVSFGALSMQSDYGERGEINSSLTGNIGYTTSLVLYKNFYDRTNKWYSRSDWIQDHLKVRAEINYFKTNLNHFGRYIEGNSNGSILLRAMHGTATVVNLGAGVEYHFLNLTDFNSRTRSTPFSPFFVLGGMYGVSKATIISDMGDIASQPSLLIEAYRNNSTFTGNEAVSSSYFSLGSRARLTQYSELIIETRWQYFFSDKVDGLIPDTPANKYNDWTYSTTLGIVVYL